MSNYVDAQEFIENMHFITEETEERLRNNEPVRLTLNATAMRNPRNFVAFAGMLKSSLSRLSELQEGDKIDLDKLASSDIPSVLASNTLASETPSLDEDIVNVSDEHFNQLQPGWSAEVVVTLNEVDGTTYLNGQIIEVNLPDRGSTEQVDYEQVNRPEAKSEA